MRDHGSIAPAFWTGSTGRKMRKHKDARILAAYFITCPMASALGIYYLPIPSILHETGLTEEEFRAAAKWLADEGVAFYDEEREWVWAPKMARHQIGEQLKDGDKRRPWIQREIERFRGHEFYSKFLAIYGAAYRLEAPSKTLPGPQSVAQTTASPESRPISEAPSKTLFAGVEAPPKGDRVDLDLRQDQERESASPARAPDPSAGGTEHAGADLRDDAAIDACVVRVQKSGRFTCYDLEHLMRVIATWKRTDIVHWAPGKWASKSFDDHFRNDSEAKRVELVPEVRRRAERFFKLKAETQLTVERFLGLWNSLASPAEKPKSPVQAGGYPYL